MVKLTLKTVQNKLFNIDADDSETISQLKSKIQESQGFPVDLQKIIYSGKILSDASTVGSYKIKEKDFLVVMVSKAKATPAPTPAAAPVPTPSSTSTPAPTAEAAPAPAEPSTSTPMETDAPAPAASEQPSGLQGGSFVSGPALQSAISGMVEMGFERDQVMRALKASFNNPDRAVEYLMNGDIPDVESSAPAPAVAPAPAAAAPETTPLAAATPATAPASTPAPAAGGGSDNLFAAAEAAMNRDRGSGGGATGGAGAGAGAGAGGDELAALANSPVVQQLRQMVQENPALIQPLLQQIATTNPQLAQLINQNPQALYDLLGVGEADEGEYPEGAQVMQVNLTQDEAAAVERLEQLGFDRQMVLQAYMLCDKDEELAANFLFEAGEEDM